MIKVFPVFSRNRKHRIRSTLDSESPRRGEGWHVLIVVIYMTPWWTEMIKKLQRKAESTILPSWKYSHCANSTHQVWTCLTPHSSLHRRQLSHSCGEVMSPHIWMLQELAFFPALPWNCWSEPLSSQGSVPNARACKDLFFEKYLNVSPPLREFLVIWYSISKLWSALSVF